MQRAAIAGAIGALVLSGCTWVALTPAGNHVRVARASEVDACQKLGATGTKTSDRAWVFARDPRKVERELEHLARNEAAEMGGDTVVPTGPVEDLGRRRYWVYRCAGGDAGDSARARHHQAMPPTSATPARL